MENYYDSQSNENMKQDIPEDNKPQNSESPKQKVKTSIDAKTIFAAIIVFILVASASTGLFYYLKNKKKNNAVTPVRETIAELLPDPDSSKVTAAPKKEENKDTAKSATPNPVPTSTKENKTQAKETKKEETVIVTPQGLDITTIAPDNGGPVASNPFYIALTTNNPAIAYFESVEYFHKNGSTSSISGSITNSSYSNSLIVSVPKASDVTTVKVKLIIKDIHNQTLTKYLTYQAL